MLLIYQRVSSTEQAADDRSSLENQERIGRGFAMTKGFNQFDIATYCDPGVSATIPLRRRPAGQRLLEDMKPGDYVFASKLDRMFRSASDACNMAEIFKEKGINLVLFDLGSEPINSSGISQFFFTIIAAVAQLERTMIRERMEAGKKAKREKKGHAGGVAPYGYRIVGHGRAAQLEPVEADLQRPEAEHHQDEAEDINVQPFVQQRPPFPAQHLRLRHQPADQGQREQADGQVDQEHPVPGQVVGDPAAHDRADGGRADHGVFANGGSRQFVALAARRIAAIGGGIRHGQERLCGAGRREKTDF